MARSAESVHAVIKAYDVRGVVGELIDAAFVQDVGGAFARLVRDDGAKKVVVGHDMRASSPDLVKAFAHGVTAHGVDVVLIGLASTDQLYFASGLFDCPGAMFTASHNPAEYNGIKLCRAGAKPVGQETGLATIAAEVTEGVPEFDGAPGAVTDEDVLERYASFVRGLVNLADMRPLKVAVDAGNGMGGHTVPAVLEPMPVTLEPLFFELDGTFPNHEANPLDPANLVDLQEHVRKTGADIGLAFDGDADRCFVVDELGNPVSPSAVTALVAERELAKEPGATIIHNLITSRAVPELVTELGGSPVRTRVGHSFIKQQMAETGAVFGGEHSAHYYFRSFWGADSGMLAGLHVLAALGEQERPLSELMAKYERYAASGEINSTVADAAERTAAVVSAFADRTTGVDRLDGVTVDLAGGAWFNLRASNTEPLLRLNVEAPTAEDVDALVTEILGIVRS
ncbi:MULTISPECIES: phosphomannomutase/phosphoglucomutase [Rhodococcus]|uniref:Phosphomannomutase/phosphoglucomutase n=1 Tax=Rhodococcus oxybenzonivorans TaxID=1990687 RepID=A0AAE5A792_9NOCA|nr:MULTISPECIES: phosphomannomutase/phosphoglucomutase [Rhodococcus]MDV7244599.1 phosphomannomutase/phosphoglucomutase [Rhodococcus oxybenzonivorans]MDV7266467.1 phosphomannomutase/phosphoglucomutase [Rhodococcus oxybenzonivorans]MDV7275900.1 phosphomannomutase/phosphoglucomutase [Rhodococcus oxybenzonivorans]MDV7332679.1 phosphomannomutase/phosphoglucomutase [Rhodococcus oxybenzonivorans]MDV7346475.1 phosphomannomutase/phosphoglucomutase [Rhodococcus oxybenzonivorans]